MKEQTYLSAELDSADQNVRYDAAVKRVLATKCILARILVGTVPEFRDYSYEEAEKAIIGTPEIASRRVRPDARNKTEAVQSLGTDSRLPGEGEVTFDIVFSVLTRKGEPQKMYINIEAQKSVQLPYDLVSRSIFYPARLMSEQLDREFTTSSYDKIKKVYSIWICMNSPAKSVKRLAADTIVQYGITPTVIYPTENLPKMSFGRYDLFSTIFINLTADGSTTGDELIGMLSTLLSEVIDTDTKKKILEEQYHIPMVKTVDEEVQGMCNLSEGIVERTTERVTAKVTAQVKEEMDKKYSSILSEKDQALSEKDREIARLKKLLAEAGQ